MRIPRCCLTLALLVLPAPLLAQPAEGGPAALPAPAWVQKFDQGEVDPNLKGLQTPRGFELEVVAGAAQAGKPDDIGFDDEGVLWVLDRGRLRRLDKTDRDGKFDEVELAMNDLGSASAILAHGGWIYWTSGGRVLRRRPHDDGLLDKLQAAATAKTGPPTQKTTDRRWIEQPLVSGLSDRAPYQASGLAMGADGWLYVTTGSGDQRAASWDGSRVTVLRSGAILRMRPDGSRLEEFARGLLAPRKLAIDPLGHAFAADADWNAAGAKGLRLIHVLAGGDYVWQNAGNGARDDKEKPASLDAPDHLRAAAAGERSGTLPPMLRAADGSQSDVLWWDSPSFPEFCRGLLICAEEPSHRLRAYRVQRSGATFRAGSQFDLLSGGDAFRPVAAATGPDGGLYVADQPAGEGGRILRLSWSGTKEAPAIELAPRDSWSKLKQLSDEELAELLAASDGETQNRIAQQLAARGKQDLLRTLVADAAKPVPARAAALAALSQNMDAAGREAIAKLLGDEKLDLSRLAATALGDFPPREEEALLAVAEEVKSAPVAAADPLQQRALQLALGKLAAAAKSIDLAEWTFEGTSVTHGPKMSREVFDGHVRALELVPGAAKELMLGNLDVALNLPEADPLERARIKEFVTLTGEAMRTRELAEFLDALLLGDPNLFVRLEAPLESRLLACYRNVLADPPITADALAAWLEKNPGGPVEIEIAALETLSLVGTSKEGYVVKLADRLLMKPADAVLVAKSFRAGKLDRSLLPRIQTALASHKGQDSSGDIAAMQKELESLKPPAP